MADPTQIVGTPALNPPADGDPGWLADTPQSTDNYDVVIGGVGFMLFRDPDDSAPDRRFKTEPFDFTYSPVFIDRSNASGNLGDDQQAFYMTFVQRDWSGGIGQKYFRKDQDPQSRMFWEGSRLTPTMVPGAVRLGSADSNLGAVSTDTSYTQVVYHNRVGNNASGISIGGSLVRIESTTSGTTAATTYRYSTDGGATWTVQATSGGPGPAVCDQVDACVGDDGNIYLLDSQSSIGSTSIIRRIAGPNPGATLAWDSTTAITVTGNAYCNCMCFWNSNLYVADLSGKLKQVAFGTSSAQTTIKDFGGGIIVQLMPTPRGIYVLYMAPQGDYRIFLYDGTANVSEVAHLPAGWRTAYTVERQCSTIPGIQNTPTTATVKCMCYLDGVLYVTGMMPARDYAQAGAGSTPYRTSLWYYASGNSGIIWQAEQSNAHQYASGGPGFCAPIKGGLVSFPDSMNSRLMAYDPGTAGVFPLGTLAAISGTSKQTTTAITVNGTINSVATTLTVAGVIVGPLNVGDVLTCNGTGEKALVIDTAGGTTATILRGYLGTTPSNTTFVNGATISIVPPMPPAPSLAYDPINDVGAIPWFPWGPRLGRENEFYSGVNGLQSGYTLVNLRPGPDYGGAASGVLATSQFDFDSSLDKYFKDVVWDGDTTQLPNQTNEKAGSVDLYYRLNGTSSATTDTGVVLIQTGAVPGTRYAIGATGRSVQILAVLNAAAGSGAQPISQGPVIRRLSVRGVPIQPGYRSRAYQLALFTDMATKQGFIEPRTPATLRRNLESLLSAGSPVTVSDEGMTNVTCAFIQDKCVIREMKAGEYVAYVELREV